MSVNHKKRLIYFVPVKAFVEVSFDGDEVTHHAKDAIDIVSSAIDNHDLSGLRVLVSELDLKEINRKAPPQNMN